MTDDTTTTEQATVNAQAEDASAQAHEEDAVPSVDALMDYLADLDGNEAILLFELIGSMDPLRTENGNLHYGSEQRHMMMSMAQLFREAGFNE